jgi:GNAT superfamily N-acetyltransferase
MIELSFELFAFVQDLFVGCHCIPLGGVFGGWYKGRIFVDDVTSPSAAYVWTPWGYHYFAGTPNNVSFNQAMRKMLADELQPESAAVGESNILLTLAPEGDEVLVGDILPSPTAIKIYRSTFKFNKTKFQSVGDWKSRIPIDFSMAYIDANLAARLTDVICATWRNIDEFLERGFGYCLLEDGNILSVCHSAFIARNEVEIGISTENTFRRRGYGSLTAAAMITHCLENGFSPHWECFWDNEPSVALANKLGFEKTADVPIYYWEGPPAL